METAAQKATAQKGTNVNGLELNIVSIGSISVPNHHPRLTYSALEELQSSLRRDGLQDPLLVYETGEGSYGVIDGARRLKAAEGMGWKQIACLIKKKIDHATAAHLSYVKNVERKTYSVIEIARHIQTMRDTFGYTLRDLELMGYGTHAAISLKLKLLKLPESVQDKIHAGELTAEHGRQLGKLPTAKNQEQMAKRIMDHELTAKRAKTQIDAYLRKGKQKIAEKRSKSRIPKSRVSISRTRKT